jgi:hypothetical protein
MYHRALSLIVASAFALGCLAANPGAASAFWPGKVVNVAANDALMIRKWPGATSQVIDAYPNGTPVSLTGRCKDITTNVSFRVDGKGTPQQKHFKMKQPNVWCQVMTAEDGLGWARGKYLWAN